ncbi:uncharacterized protein LAJ45_07139 [Morchella importuna]|uniref:uncharacterized protein n=1 Tax=Morchella importuna TaxID=1174673 RepID=UPI001E8DB030|nr:uncharacterized protein LAJ45_07139 [Morchella importuna]KAH8148796.1 hypothetical protein LAJ45_07139 [Morchella importuna]
MRPLLLAILVFIAGYITARFSLITQAVELAYFAWDNGVVVNTPFSRSHPSDNSSPPWLGWKLILPTTHLANWGVCVCAVQGRATKGFLILSLFFFLFFIPIERIASRETSLQTRSGSAISAREQLRRRGSFY